MINRDLAIKPRRWKWAIWALLPALAAIPFLLSKEGASIFKEDRIIEGVQSGMLFLAIIAGAVIALLLGPGRCRYRSLAIAALAALALARELDLHTALNPEQLGQWGVRYRPDWWTDPDVILGAKLLWGAVVASIIAAAVIVIQRGAGPINWSHPRPRLVALALALYALGFIFDDILRDSLPATLRLVIEELAELLAAACILGAALDPESTHRDRKAPAPSARSIPRDTAHALTDP